jgi:hypothetical protein
MAEFYDKVTIFPIFFAIISCRLYYNRQEQKIGTEEEQEHRKAKPLNWKMNGMWMKKMTVSWAGMILKNRFISPGEK